MPANTTKIKAAKLISEYRENELKKKITDLNRLQLLAGNNRTPASANTRRIALIVLILAIIVGVVWFKSCSAAHDTGKKDAVSLKKVYEKIWPFSNTSTSSEHTHVPAPYVTPTTDAARVIVSTENGLRVTQTGELVIDRQTRADIEKLSEVTNLQELHDEIQALRHTLPPAAAEQAVDLVERYYRFRIAVAERMPSKAASTPQDVLRRLDGIAAIRAEYFGPELAKQWFSESDALDRKLIEEQMQRRP